MIIEVKRYQVAGEHKLFETIEEAEKYEEEIKQSSVILTMLNGYKEYGSDFNNGYGKVQISEKTYLRALSMYENILEEKFGTRNPHPRYIDDSDKSPAFSKLTYLFRCISAKKDGYYYKVGQPYYANLKNLYSNNIVDIID